MEAKAESFSERRDRERDRERQGWIIFRKRTEKGRRFRWDCRYSMAK